MSEEFDILIVDDDDLDAEIFIRSSRSVRDGLSFKRARNGVEAIELLKVGLPRMVFMDIKMPGKDGLETLCEIKADKRSRHIPVIMMSSTLDENDIAFCYENYANAFVSKPADIEESNEIAQSINDFWWRIACTPDAPGKPA